MVKKFNEYSFFNLKIRWFNHSNDINSGWHTDEYDRIVFPLVNSGWQFQFDNMLPRGMNIFNAIKLPKGVFHRIIKPNSQTSIPLIVLIIEFKD